MAALHLNYEYTPPAIVCLLGVISNLLLLNVFIKDPLKCFKNSGSYLMINLAVSDFLTCSTAPFYFFICGGSCGSYLQFVLKKITFYFVHLSCLTIVSLSIDRYLLISHPLKHRILLNGKRIVVWIATLWIICICFFSKEMIFGMHYEEIIFPLFDIMVIVFSALLYSLTCFALVKQMKNLAALQNHSAPASRAEEKRILKEKKFLKTIIIIACIAFLCILPFRVLYSVSVLKNNLDRHSVVYIIFNAIFFANFAVNPLVYVVRLSNYRKSFSLLYCKRR